MNDLQSLMLYKYVNRLYVESENEVVEVKNRISYRVGHASDYADLAIALARQETTLQICDDLIKILQNWNS